MELDNTSKYVNEHKNTYNESVSIITDEIFKMYKKFNYDDLEFFEYNFYDYKFSETFTFDIIISIFQKKIRVSITNTNISNGELEDCLLSQVLFNKNDEEIIENIKILLNKIYNLKNIFCYSKILDSLISKEKIEYQEKLYLAKNFISHNYIDTCCVCLEQNIILTPCDHNLCKVCYFEINKELHAKCPMCRMCLSCLRYE